MMVLLQVLLFLILIIVLMTIYLLLAPFYLEIDSVKHQFRFRFHRLASVYLLLEERSVFIKIRSIFWNKRYDLLAIKKGMKKAPDTNYPKDHDRPKKGGRKKAISPYKVLRKAKGVIKSFQVKIFVIQIDTGDNYTNGVLFPYMYIFKLLLRQNISVNFHNENMVMITIRNSMGRILWAYLRS